MTPDEPSEPLERVDTQIADLLKQLDSTEFVEVLRGRNPLKLADTNNNNNNNRPSGPTPF